MTAVKLVLLTAVAYFATGAIAAVILARAIDDGI